MGDEIGNDFAKVVPLYIAERVWSEFGTDQQDQFIKQAQIVTEEMVNERTRSFFTDQKHPLRANNEGAQKVVKKMVENVLEGIKRKNNLTTEEEVTSFIGIDAKTLRKLRNTPQNVSRAKVEKLCEAGHITIGEIIGAGGHDYFPMDDFKPLRGMGIEYLLTVEEMDSDTVAALYELADTDTRRLVTLALRQHLRHVDEIANIKRLI